MHQHREIMYENQNLWHLETPILDLGNNAGFKSQMKLGRSSREMSTKHKTLVIKINEFGLVGYMCIIAAKIGTQILHS